MKIEEILNRKVIFITPCFAHGQDQKNPEVTGPSVKGMLRLWAERTVGLEKTREIFGFVDKGKEAKAKKGKVLIRVTEHGDRERTETIPHNKTSKEQAIKPGGGFTLQILGPKELKGDIETIVRAWVTLGGIGLRKNRAGGSLWGKEIACLEESVKSLRPEWKVKIWESSKGKPLAAEGWRRLCGMTANEDKFREIDRPLGGIGDKKEADRKGSEIEFKVVPRGVGMALLGVYPERSKERLREAGGILTGLERDLGSLLESL